MRRLAAVTAVASVLLLAIAADEPKKDVTQDPQAKVEPRSAPGAGQKYLERFVGAWEVAKTFHPRSGEPSRVKGTCKQSMIQGGRFLQSEFTFGEGDRQTTGLGLIGFEPETGAFTSVWIDSRQTRMSHRRSRDAFDGSQIVLHSEPLGAEGKDTRRSKTVSKIEDGGRRIVHRQYALGTGGEERLVMELLMTRVGEAGSLPQ